MSEFITRTKTKRKFCNREGAFTCEGGYWVIVSLELWLTINKIIKKKWKFRKRKNNQIGTCTKRQCLLKAIALCLKSHHLVQKFTKSYMEKIRKKKRKKIYSNLHTHSTNQVIPWPLLDFDVSDTSLKIDFFFFFWKDWGVIKNYKDWMKEMSNKLLRN